MLKRPIFVQSNICKKYRIRKLWIYFKSDEKFWPIIEQFLLSETNDENENIELSNICIEDDYKKIYKYCITHPLLYEYMINDKKLKYVKNERFKEFVLKKQDKVFSDLSINNNNTAIKYLSNFPHKISWDNLCANNCDEAIKIVKTEFERIKNIFETTEDVDSFEDEYISQFYFGNINVAHLAENTHPEAIKILEYFYNNSKDKKLDYMFDSDGESIGYEESNDDKDETNQTVEEKNMEKRKMILRELINDADSELLGNPMAKNIIEHHIKNRTFADDAEQNLYNNPCVSAKYMKIACKILGIAPQFMISENPSPEIIELLFTRPENEKDLEEFSSDSKDEDESVYLDDKYKTKGKYKWVNWQYFLYNKSERACEIISRNLHRYENQKEFSYPVFFNNPYLFPIAEKFLNKSIEKNNEEEIQNILWRMVDNPRAMYIIYSWDFNKMRDQNKLFAEELASYVFHSLRLQRFSEKYGISFETLNDMY